MSQLLRNVLSAYVVRLIGVLTAIFLFPMIVNSVGLTHAGLWVLISSVSIFFATSDFGLGTSVVRYVADARAREDAVGLNVVVSTSLCALVVLGAIGALGFSAFFAVFWGAFDIPKSDRGMATAMVGLVAFFQLGLALPLNSFRQVLTGIHRMDLSSGATLLQTLLRVVLIVVALAAGGGIVGVVIAEAVAVLVTSAAAALVCFRLIPELRMRRGYIRLSLLREMAPYSARVFVIGLSGLVILQSSSSIVAAFLPVAAVALYGGAFRLYQVCRDITAALQGAVVPDASAAHARGDKRRLGDLMVRGTKYGNAVLLLLAVPVMVFAEPILVAWLGPRFAEVGVVVQILIAGLVLNNNHLVGVGLLTGTGGVSKITRYHIIWALSSVGLALALVQGLELPGVALGVSVPLLVLEPLYIRLALAEFGVEPRRFLLHAVARPLGSAVLGGLVLAVVVAAYHPSGLLGVIAASALYAGVFAVAFARLGMNRGERARLLRLPRPSMGA